MNDMFSSILNLLQSNTCVVVPALGGFVANRKSAFVDAASGKFCPPSLQVVFNPRLNHNDGLLSQELASARGLSMNEAQSTIETSVVELKNNLAATNIYKVEGFGTFHLVNGNIAFTSEISFSEWSESVGLNSFFCPTLAEAEKKEKKSFPWKQLAGIGAAASLALCIFLPSMQNMENNLASFNPFQVHSSSIVKDSSVISQQMVQDNDKVFSQEQVDKMSQLIADSVRAQVMSEMQPSRYYVILSQFDSQKDADSFVEKWQNRLSDKLTVELIGSETYGVACAKTEDPKLAVKMMNNVRNNSSFKQTFLFYK